MHINEWIAALRSGNYDQAQCYLRTGEDRYCCLGVLCDLINPEGWSASCADGTMGWHWADGYGFLPPDRIYDDVEGVDSRLARTLAHANDGGASFETIANALAAHANGGSLDDELAEFLEDH